MNTLDCPRGYDNPHVPTPELRGKVKGLYAAGVSQDAIAKRLNITDDTLRRHYRADLDEAIQDIHETAAMVVCKKMYNDEDFKAAVFWLTHRAGWRPAALDKDNDSAAQVVLDMIAKSVGTNAKS